MAACASTVPAGARMRRSAGWVQLKEGSNVPVGRAVPAPASDTTLSQ